MPPKVMKAMKSKASAMKSRKTDPCQKGSKNTTKKVMKSTLKAKNLAKLGKLSLAEKVAKAAENTESPNQAAQNIKGMLSKQEHSRVWSKFNCHMKGQSKKEQKELQKKSKGEKGMLAALHMVKSSVPKFFHASEFLESSTSLKQKEKWISEAKMIDRFGEEVFWLHVESGRVSWRADPWTAGVYEYRDNGDITREVNVKKGRDFRAGQEYQANDEDAEAWGQYYGHDNQWYFNDWQAKGKGKTLTKGSLTKGKGEGNKKGKGKGSGMLALTNGNPEEEEEHEEDEEEKTPEEEWKDILSKARKARDQGTSSMADCQAALELADKAKRLTKTGKAESEELLKGMNKKHNTLKDLLAKKEKWGSLARAKALLLEAANDMKKVKAEAKELNQLANKTHSKASKQ